MERVRCIGIRDKSHESRNTGKSLIYMSFLAIALILPQSTWDKFEVKVIFRGVKSLIYIAFMVDRTEKRTKSEMSQWNVGVSDWEKKSRAKIAVFPRMLG